MRVVCLSRYVFSGSSGRSLIHTSIASKRAATSRRSSARTSMSPRLTSISSASRSVDAHRREGAARARPSKVSIDDHAACVLPDGSTISSSPVRTHAGGDLPREAAVVEVRAEHVLHREAEQVAEVPVVARSARSRGARAASGRRTRACSARASTTLSPRERADRARSARRRSRAGAAKSRELVGDARRRPRRRKPTRSILFTHTTRCGMPSSDAM